VSYGDGGSQAAALMAVLDLEERQENVFVGLTPATSLQRIFGGQVAGQAIMAAGLTVTEERPVHSLHAYFLRPGDPNENIRYAVDAIRDGRSFSTRRVLAYQQRRGEEVAIFALTADFHAAETEVVAHRLPMPKVPGPDEVPAIEELAARHGHSGGPALEIGRAVEQRPLDDPFERRPRLPPDTASGAWMRVAGRLPDSAAVHAAALTFVSDLTLLGASLAREGGWGDGHVGASLDHAVWFHSPVRADEWFYYEIDSPAASGGLALCFGQIWAQDGTHVATVAQQGLIRSQQQ
jgi:acyl-CoA thioesterase II